jgi:hypothetical protein
MSGWPASQNTNTRRAPMNTTSNKKSRDQLTTTTDEGKIELQEQELSRVAGGLKITLKQVYVTSYQLGGTHGDD